MKTYTQLSYDVRCQIYVLNKTGNTQAAIATAVGTSQSTISRELRRNKGSCGYRYKQAQNLSENRRLIATSPLKMTPQMIHLIDSKLSLKWSPDQISGWLRRENDTLISYETIYQYIWRDKHSGGQLYQYLRRKGKRYQSRRKSYAGRGHIKNRVSIDERPAIVEEKSRVGDWEIDLVIGKGHSGALVTIVDRATSFTVSKRVNSKSADVVTAATITLLAPYKAAVLTITADNGKEFAYHEKMTEALGAAVYFADPYSSWQRGLNENTNGLLRQYWPKHTDFKQVTPRAVASVIASLNNRPRKKLDYQTPADKMAVHMAALTA